MEFSGDALFSWAQYLARLRQYFGDYGRISHIFYVAADLDPDAFLLRSA